MQKHQQPKNQKSTLSVSTSLILILLASISLGACSSVDAIDVRTVESERVQLNIPNTATPRLGDVEFVVITKDNFDEVFAEFGANQSPVLFALRVEDYEALALNLKKVQSYIVLQNSILEQYREYYEGNSNGQR